jgi:HSP20 family protein
MPKNNTKQTKARNGPKSLDRPQRTTDTATRLAATPFEFMKRFGEEMDRLFGDFGFGRGWLTPGTESALGGGLWAPQVEMFEREGELVVRADLPGLAKDDVTVEVNDDGITIEGERRSEQEENSAGFYRSERSYGKFYRRLPLPEGVSAENARAVFENGVLEIAMDAPKRTDTKARKLEISDASTRAHRKAA